MSSTPPATTEPISPPASVPDSSPLSAAPALGPAAPAETAPSAIVAEGPLFARIIGFLGLFLTVLGVVVVATTRATGTPRMVPEWIGLLSTAFGLVLMLCHAISDREQEIRRMYGIVAAALLVLAIVMAILPGSDGTSAKAAGYYFMPWGLAAGLLALLFAVPFVKHETEEVFREYTLYGLLGLGGLLCIAAVMMGIFRQNFPVGTQVAMALLGIGFLSAYLSQVSDVSDGLGYTVAFTLGVVGAAVLFLAFAWAVFPTVLYEGPRALRTPKQTLDKWSAVSRGLVILVFLGIAVLGARGKFPMWLRGALGAVGLIVAGVFIVACFKATSSTPPDLFLVPRGLVLGGIGLLYLVIALGVCSDSQFVTLTRRELSAYFFSPIGYLVLGGMAACQWFGYLIFYARLSRMGQRQIAIPEPIVSDYLLALIPVLCVVLPVPALTMRLLSEEKRTGSLEVLLTCPVNEWPVILSKFLATWIFFLICWLPAGLFLIAVQVEAGTAFDYRPLLSFYAALAVCSAAFIACGVFFSTLTSNQIVSAVLTFMVLLGLVVCYWVKQVFPGITPTMQAFLTRLSFIDLWQQSLEGQLSVRDILVWASAAVFGLFLSVKVLEARKWN
jgi:ABC-type transport system involved in multi-copper enzyme maturation permease subunit